MHRMESVKTRLFIDDCILYTFFDILTHSSMQIILLVSFRQQNKILETDIPFRSETPGYFHKLNWSSLYVLLVLKLQYNETSFSDPEPKCRHSKTVLILVLHDVNVRESNVRKPSLKESVLIRGKFNSCS